MDELKILCMLWFLKLVYKEDDSEQPEDVMFRQLLDDKIKLLQRRGI